MSVRAFGFGFYIGMWLAALATSGYGLWFVCSHPYGGYDDHVWAFYLWLSFGPIWMLFLRFWKWTLTALWVALAVALGQHEARKLDKLAVILTGAWAGWEVAKPANRQAIAKHGAAYGRWLVARASVPGKLIAPDRFVLRLACVFGIAVYCFSAFSVYPHDTVLDNNAVVPEPEQKSESYSQNDPVIHNACVVPTQMTGRSNIEFPAIYSDSDSHRKDDPNLIQAADNELNQFEPGTNLLTWVHKHRLYHWNSARHRWVAVKGYYTDVDLP